MVLRMKNFNIFGVYWKIRLLRDGGGHEKPIYKEGLPKKGGLEQFKRDLVRKKGWCFWGGWYPNAHCDVRKLLKVVFKS